jgi:hypothetical protein
MSKGQIVDLYIDQENVKCVGKGRLLECKGSNLPFILKEPIIYNTESWLVEIVESDVYPKGFKKIFKIRYIQSLTKVANENKKEEISEIEDNFSIMKIDTSFWNKKVDGSELLNDAF